MSQQPTVQPDSDINAPMETSTPQTQPQAQAHNETQTQTASEYITSQLALEASAREIMPYSFKHCTSELDLDRNTRQSVFACLTCNPPPDAPDPLDTKSDLTGSSATATSDEYVAAGVCYACSIACHGEHVLVELFTRRNFTCDCGTGRYDTACTLRLGVDGTKGAKGLPVNEGNAYNQNYRNRFCGCKEWYVAEMQKGTMFQCLGLNAEKDGGCGEDWWHAECLLGVERKVKDEGDVGNGEGETEHPLPDGFPAEEDFEHLICWRCVDRNPWIRRYAKHEGWRYTLHTDTDVKSEGGPRLENGHSSPKRKRKNEDEEDTSKRLKLENGTSTSLPSDPTTCSRLDALSAPAGRISLFAPSDFRSHLCRCSSCYAVLRTYPFLLDDESTYEPSVTSSDGDESLAGGTASIGSRSLLERGEAALSNVDRVRAIEGVMVYNHLKDKVKAFLAPFAESGTAVSADDIKRYFEQLRGDEGAIQQQRERRDDEGSGSGGSAGGDGTGRTEQKGY